MTDGTQITAGDRYILSPIGELNFTLGYPTPWTSQKLYDVLDFQRAVQLYIWGLPIVSFAVWRRAHQQILGARDLRMVSYSTFAERLNILSADATTPYIAGFADLRRTGPVVVHVPQDGAVHAAISDAWQRPIVDAGRGGAYLILGPGQEAEAPDGYHVARSRTHRIAFGASLLAGTKKETRALMGAYRVQKWSDVLKGRESKRLRYVPATQQWSPRQPEGLEYFRVLAEALRTENREERDAMAYAMVESLGLDTEAFAPDERLGGILADAAVIGEAMVRAMDYDPRRSRRWWEDRTWENVPDLGSGDQMDGARMQLDERAAWFYEAVTSSPSMVATTPDAGRACLTTRRDARGNWLDGSATYRLRVPSHPPVGMFWSVTAYNNDTRCLVDTPEARAECRSTDRGLTRGEDGSVEIWFSARRPQGVEEANWIPTRPGEGWFVDFRFYGPLEAFFDRSWKLEDLERQDG